jgi:hypothetical protein
MLRGRTDQGRPFRLLLVGSTPDNISTTLDVICPSGPGRAVSWTPADHDPVPFDWDGERLQVRETGERSYAGGVHGHVVLVLDAHVGPSHAAGTMRAVETYTYPSGARTICDSGPVSLTLHPAV